MAWRWKTRCTDICQFQLVGVTKYDINGTDVAFHHDWAAFSFGADAQNCQRFVNEFTFAIDVNGTGKVAIGSADGPGREIIDFSQNSTFVYQPPNHNGCSWTVTKQNASRFQLRSDCCPYAFDWLASGEDSGWVLYISDGQKYRDENLQGMCGNCDDDVINDWAKCFDIIPLPLENTSLPIISDSCQIGKDHGSHPEGGRKLDC